MHDNPGWRSESKMLEGVQEVVEEKDDEDGRPGDARLLTQCDEEEIMFTFASGAAVSAMPRTCSQRAGDPRTSSTEWPRDQRYRTSEARRSRRSRRTGSAQSVTFLTCVRDQSTGIGELCQRMNRVVATSRTKCRDGRCPCVRRTESM